jgi:hypothetical protein
MRRRAHAITENASVFGVYLFYPALLILLMIGVFLYHIS